MLAGRVGIVGVGAFVIGACSALPHESSDDTEPSSSTTAGATTNGSGASTNPGTVGTTVDPTGNEGEGPVPHDMGVPSTTSGDPAGSTTTDGPPASLCKDGVTVPGDLCLEAEYAYPTVTNPRTLALGDLDDDGNLDLVVGSDSTNFINLLIGVGDGGFDPLPDMMMDVGATDFVFLTTLDDDMLPDLLVVDATNRRLLALLNEGEALGAPVVTTFSETPAGAAIGHLDDDDLTDVAIVTTSSTMVPFKNTTLGTFAQEAALTVGAGPADLKIADLDDNGWSDIVSANASARTASLIYNTAGVLTVAEATLAGENSTRSLGLGDLDEDGMLDIVLANHGADTLSVLLSDAGGFAEPEIISVLDRPTRVLALDMDGDAHLDLVVAEAGNFDLISVHVGAGDGTFTAAAEIDVAGDPTDVAAGDFNGDGALDLAVTHTGGDAGLTIILSDT